MKVINFTTTHITDTTNNSTLEYEFPSSIDFNENHSIAVGNISMFYSWYNISSAKNNNVFAYEWNGVTHNITLPNMLGEIKDINAYLQLKLIENFKNTKIN